MMIDRRELARLDGAFGPGLSAFESLANLRIGTMANGQRFEAAFSFVAKYSGSVRGVWFYFPLAPGYAGGNFGTIDVSLQHNGRELGRGNHAPVNAGRSDQVEVSIGGEIEAGKRYELVFTNTSTTAGDFVSVDCAQSRFATFRPHPANKTDYALYRVNGGEWINVTQVGSDRKCIKPLFEVRMVDGRTFGWAAFESGATQPRSFVLDKDIAIREAFDARGEFVLRGVSFNASCIFPGRLRVAVWQNNRERVRWIVNQHNETDWGDGSLRKDIRVMAGQWYRLPCKDIQMADAPFTVDIVPLHTSKWRFCGHRSAKGYGLKDGTWSGSYGLRYNYDADEMRAINVHDHTVANPLKDQSFRIVIHAR